MEGGGDYATNLAHAGRFLPPWTEGSAHHLETGPDAGSGVGGGCGGWGFDESLTGVEQGV